MGKKIPKNSKYDIGLRSTYNYHNGRHMGQKMSLPIMQAWFPKDAKVQEYYILKRLYELSDGKDNVSISLPYNDYALISSLFMTYDTPELVVDGKRRFDISTSNLDNCMRRAIKRFDEMKSVGVVDGTVTSPCITFYGIQKLQSMMEPVEDSSEIISTINALKADIESSSDVNIQILDTLNQIAKNTTNKATLMEHIDDLNKLSELGKNGLSAVQFVQKHWNSILTLFSMLIKLIS